MLIPHQNLGTGGVEHRLLDGMAAHIVVGRPVLRGALRVVIIIKFIQDMYSTTVHKCTQRCPAYGGVRSFIMYF